MSQNQVTVLECFVFFAYVKCIVFFFNVVFQGSRSEAVYENDISADPLLFRFKKHRRKKVSRSSA